MKPADKANATKAVEAGWEVPANKAVLLRSVARMHADVYADRVKAALTDKNPEVAQAASLAAEKLGLQGGAAPAMR